MYIGTFFANKLPDAYFQMVYPEEKKMNPFSELKEYKTLLVDDDDLIRDSLSRAFASKACSLRTVESAAEGLEALQKEDFDIVISELRLPGKGGLCFLKQAASRRPQALHVLFTSYRDDHLLAETSFVGIDDLVEKPFSINTLASALVLSLKKQEKKSNVLK